MPCPVGSYAANVGQAQCIPCPHRLSSPEAAAACSLCAEGFYLVDGPVDPSTLLVAANEHCLDCPEHATCPWNTTLQTIRISAMHWRISDRSRVLTLCTGAGAEHRCLGGARAGIEGEGYCGELHSGPECLLCRGDFNGSNLYMSNGECLKVPPIIRSQTHRWHVPGPSLSRSSH